MNKGIKTVIMNFSLLLVTAAFSFAEDVPFSRVARLDWNLAIVRKGENTVVIDRTKAQREIYSIRFHEGRIRGRGADNVYFASYKEGANNSLSIGKIAGTYMASLFEMENFSEREYFKSLEKVYRWEFHSYRLKLFTRDENNNEVVLEFLPIYK